LKFFGKLKIMYGTAWEDAFVILLSLTLHNFDKSFYANVNGLKVPIRASLATILFLCAIIMLIVFMRTKLFPRNLNFFEFLLYMNMVVIIPDFLLYEFWEVLATSMSFQCLHVIMFYYGLRTGNIYKDFFHKWGSSVCFGVGAETTISVLMFMMSLLLINLSPVISILISKIVSLFPSNTEPEPILQDCNDDDSDDEQAIQNQDHKENGDMKDPPHTEEPSNDVFEDLPNQFQTAQDNQIEDQLNNVIYEDQSRSNENQKYIYLGEFRTHSRC